MVGRPSVADGRMALADRDSFQALAGGSIDAVGCKGKVVNRRVVPTGTQIPRLLDFHTLQVQHHHPEARGQIGVAFEKTDMIDAFVSRNLAAFDVGKVIGEALVDDVDIGVVVGHHQALRGKIIGQGGDTHVVQSVALAHGRQTAVSHIIAKHTSPGAGIDSVASIGHVEHLRIVETGAPFSNGSLSLEQTEKRK